MTEPFSLPVFQVLQVTEEFKSGSNRPLLVRAVNKADGNRADCVLKPNGGERMGLEAMLREVVAAYWARSWGIHTVEPVLLQVDADLIRVSQGQEWYELLSRSTGVNYGSIYLSNYRTLLSGQPLNREEFKQAQMIFAFDVFIQNADRRKQKPNLMSNGQNLVIFDHELAFSYTKLIIKPSEPWNVKLEGWIEEMFLYPLIKGKLLPESQIEASLSSMADEMLWKILEQALPSELCTLDEYQEIKQFCTSVAGHANPFTKNLQKLVV